LPTSLRVVPLKGFENAAAAIAELLGSALGPLLPDGDELLDALGVWRLQPAAHGARWLPEVGPAEPADRVVGLFLGALLESVERNTPGLRADLDIEFLHDVRVALRRTRSLLRELAAEPAVAATAPLEEELAWLAGRSGACRDLDVLAETLPRYLGVLSEDRRRELGPLVARVGLRRDACHRLLVADLASSRSDAILELWRRRAATLRDSAAGRPVGEVAGERILAAARRSLERASALDEESPDAKIHRLRIRCKRLRYLLEFFRGLYPTDRVDPVIVTLRRLQDRLGSFQDLSVHTELLRDTALTPGPEPSMDADALLATGTLLAGLDRRKERQRRRILKALDRFLDEEPVRVARLLGERP
jgi:CHAD domain-containing protein